METQLRPPGSIIGGPPIVIVPIQAWTTIAHSARCSLRSHFRRRSTQCTSAPRRKRTPYRMTGSCSIAEPSRGWHASALVSALSFPLVMKPILEYVLETERQNPGRQIAVIVPELVERHWYHYPLHNQRAELLKAFLLLKGSRQIVLINVPWYIKVRS